MDQDKSAESDSGDFIDLVCDILESSRHDESYRHMTLGVLLRFIYSTHDDQAKKTVDALYHELLRG